MTVDENIEFGLRARRTPTKERARRVRDMVDLVELGDYWNAMPNELSGEGNNNASRSRELWLWRLASC
jgi:2-aminoethylphosphonate transport system ATP-binding protein